MHWCTFAFRLAQTCFLVAPEISRAISVFLVSIHFTFHPLAFHVSKIQHLRTTALKNCSNRRACLRRVNIGLILQVGFCHPQRLRLIAFIPHSVTGISGYAGQKTKLMELSRDFKKMPIYWSPCHFWSVFYLSNLIRKSKTKSVKKIGGM